MEKKTKANMDADPCKGKHGDNVIPFRPRSSHSNGDELLIEEKEVDILLCSLCGSGSFMLLADQTGQIGCNECGFLIGATWSNQDFVKYEE